MTTNKTCKDCKFYTPTTQAVFEATYDEICRARKAFKTNSEIMNDLSQIHTEASRLYNLAAEDYAKLYIEENAMAAMWQDSVNSYE